MFSLAEQMRDEKTSSFFGWRYKDRQAAIDAFEKIVIAAPYSDYAPRALSIIGRLYTEKHEGLSAIDAYQRLIAGYPNHPLVADAYWNMAQAYRGMVAGAPYDQGATVKAIQTYGEFTALFPTDDRVEEAKGYLVQMKDTLALGKYNLALYYLNKRHNPNAAITLLKDVLQVAPESPTALVAQKKLEEITSPAREAPKKSSANRNFFRKMLFWEK
jgi:outer membrane protein assembly factor BamD